MAKFHALPLALLLLGAGEPRDFTIAGEKFSQAEILDARALPEIAGGSAIMVTFGEAAAKRLAAITRAHVEKPIPILLDGEVLMQPVVREPILDGIVQISSTAPLAESAALAKRISGKDPLPESLEE